MRDHLRIVRVLIVSIAVLAAGCAAKKPAAPAATALPVMPEAGGTKVYGHIPDLSGSWVMVMHVNLQPRKDNPHPVSSIVTIYRIFGQGEQTDASRVNLKLPASVDKSIRDAYVLHVKWEPTPSELAAIGGALRNTPQSSKDFQAGFRFTSHEAYAPDMAQRPEVAGSEFAFELSDKGPGNLGAGAGHYVRIIEPDHLSGTFSAGVLSVASGAPVPIGLAGTFDLYRVYE